MYIVSQQFAYTFKAVCSSATNEANLSKRIVAYDYCQ